jgi:ABC-2 type transport system permease protein
MQVFFKELKDHLKPLLIWLVSVAVFIYMGSSEFEGYYHNPEMNEMLNLLPPQLVQAMGLGAVNITVPSGYASLLINFMLIIVGIYSLLLGSSIILREERDKTAEFLYTMPTKKGWIVFEKIMAGILLNVLLVIGIYGSFIAIMSRFEFDEHFIEFMILSSVASFLLAIIFYGVGLILSAVMNQYKKVESVGIGILLFTYIISIVMTLTDKIDFMKYFTPFAYFQSSEILKTLTIENLYSWISVCFFVVSVILTLIVYPKRDLRV